jgi:hypothetical protein
VKALRDGAAIITKRAALFVKGREGRLRGGELDKSATWAKDPPNRVGR